MYVIHVSDTPLDATSRYSVKNRKIIEEEIKLESIQEQWDTHLVESYNKQ